MYKLGPFLPLNVMKNVYYSLIYSQIIYAIEVWGSAVKSELDFNPPGKGHVAHDIQ